MLDTSVNALLLPACSCGLEPNQLKHFMRENCATGMDQKVTQSETTHMVLCKFNLDDFWVSIDGLLCIEQLLGVGQPRHQLC